MDAQPKLGSFPVATNDHSSIPPIAIRYTQLWDGSTKITVSALVICVHSVSLGNADGLVCPFSQCPYLCVTTSLIGATIGSHCFFVSTLDPGSPSALLRRIHLSRSPFASFPFHDFQLVVRLVRLHPRQKLNGDERAGGIGAFQKEQIWSALPILADLILGDLQYVNNNSNSKGTLLQTRDLSGQRRSSNAVISNRESLCFAACSVAPSTSAESGHGVQLRMLLHVPCMCLTFFSRFRLPHQPSHVCCPSRPTLSPIFCFALCLVVRTKLAISDWAHAVEIRSQLRTPPATLAVHPAWHIHPTLCQQVVAEASHECYRYRQPFRI